METIPSTHPEVRPARPDLPPLKYTIVFENVRIDRVNRTPKRRDQVRPIDRVCQNDSEQFAEMLIHKVDALVSEETRQCLRDSLAQLRKAVEGIDDGKVLMRIGQALWCHGTGLMLAAGTPDVNLSMLVNLSRADTPKPH